MDELNARLKQVQEQIAAEKGKGAARDMTFIAELEQTEAEILKKMDEVSKQQEVESKVAEAQEAVTLSFDAITVGDQTVSLRDLMANETAYQIVSIYFQQYVANMAQQNENEKQAIRNAMKNEITDITAKRDAAAAELDEAKKEIERLNSQVSDLRTEIAVGAKAAVSVTDTNLSGNLGDMIKEYKAARPAIYNVEPLDNKRSRYKAQLMETGEEVEFGYLEKGKYREVTADEAERFQAEHAATVQANPPSDRSLGVATPSLPGAPALGGIITNDTFQAEVSNDHNEVDGEPSTGPVASSPSVEERLQALEARVNKLEQNQSGVAA